MNASTYLSVNLNKVALVRNSRSLDVPSVMRAAMLCLEAGAHGITVHPRPDARHILTRDVIELATLLQAWPDREFNIEGNPLHNLMDVVGELIARHLPVHQVTFVPDDPGQFTSDHGWCFPQDARRLGPLMDQAHAWGLRDRQSLQTASAFFQLRSPQRSNFLRFFNFDLFHRQPPNT